MEKYDWRLEEIKANPGQARVPAGSPQGGQFTSTVGFQDLGVGGDPATLDQMWNDASRWGGARAEVATTALDVAEGFRTVALRDGKELVGVASMGAVDEGPGFDLLGMKGYEEIGALATKRPGYGRKMMAEIAKGALSRGHGILLHAAPGAVGFYRKLGMARSRKGKDYFFVHRNALPQIIAEWESQE